MRIAGARANSVRLHRLESDHNPLRSWLRLMERARVLRFSFRQAVPLGFELCNTFSLCLLIASSELAGLTEWRYDSLDCTGRSPIMGRT
jgi:hypothetical protein